MKSKQIWVFGVVPLAAAAAAAAAEEEEEEGGAEEEEERGNAIVAAELAEFGVAEVDDEGKRLLLPAPVPAPAKAPTPAERGLPA